MQDIGSLLIVGVIVTLLIQFLKNAFGTSSYGTLAMVAVISIIAAWGYVALRDKSFWPSFIQVLSFSGSVYTFFVQRFENKNGIPTEEVKGMFKS
jgi:hypothetical protein